MRSRRARAAVLALAVAGLAAGCGDGGDSQYRAGPFSECLNTRGANPEPIGRASTDADVSFVVSKLARQAEQENGAIRAFGAADETFPSASETAFLFFADGDAADRARQRIDDAIEQFEAKLAESAPYSAGVDRNLLMVSTRRTAAQERVIDECLGRSEE